MIQIVEEYSELLIFNECTFYDTDSGNNVFLCCNLQGNASGIDATMLQKAMSESSFNEEAKIYICGDGDIFIAWNKDGQKTEEDLKSLISAQGGGLDKKALSVHEFTTSEEKLLVMCVDKLLSQSSEQGEGMKEEVDIGCTFSFKQQASLVEQIYKRKSRGIPEILVVEDQMFSSKLITSMLGSRYALHVAENGKTALELYSAHAPHMVFLDINLPDMTGHEIAELIKRCDRQSKIVMVTANNYALDVNKARENNVDAFIAKPFNKEKIMSAVEKFLKPVSW